MEQLFGSKTRVKLLDLFMNNPGRAYYVREICKVIDEQINSVRRELNNLLAQGILKSKNENNKLYYQVREDYQHYQAFRSIFAGISVDENTGAITNTDTETDDQIKKLGSVELMAYMGGFTGDDRSGIDLIIIGDVNKTNVNNFVADLEDKEDREISYAVMTLGEYNYRRDVHDRFITLVEEAKKNIVHDPNGLMSKSTKQTVKKKGKK